MANYLAITVWQPWAMLIAEGCKRFEFRRWSAPRAMWGERIAIHAGARSVRKDEVRELLLKLHSSYWRETGLLRERSIELLNPVLMAPRRLPLSSVVCTARLGTPIRDDALRTELGLPQVAAWDALDAQAQRAIGVAALVHVIADDEPHVDENWNWEATQVTAEAALRGAYLNLNAVATSRIDLNAIGVRMCHGCGCIDDCACEGGCHWIGPHRCSRCAPKRRRT